MLDAERVCAETRVGGPFRVGELVAQDGEEAVVATAYDDVCVARGVGAVGYYCRCLSQSAKTHPQQPFSSTLPTM